MKKSLIFIKILVFSVLFLTSTSLFAKKAAIIIDYDSKEVLFEVNADTLNFPASLTKIMTLYITFDYLHKNKEFNKYKQVFHENCTFLSYNFRN